MYNNAIQYVQHSVLWKCRTFEVEVVIFSQLVMLKVMLKVSSDLLSYSELFH